MSAGQAHHDYEAHFLRGVRDEHWAGWYAAYVLGRLGDFTTPTMLTQQLGGHCQLDRRSALFSPIELDLCPPSAGTRHRLPFDEGPGAQ